jgi:putative DNA primase/helicase
MVTFQAYGRPAYSLPQLSELLPEMSKSGDHETSAYGLAAEDIMDVMAAAIAIPNNDKEPDWEHWNSVGMEIFAASTGDDAGRLIFDTWSRRQPDFYNPDLVRERWTHYRRSPPTQKGAGSLFHRAMQAQPGWVKPSRLHSDTTTLREAFTFETAPMPDMVPELGFKEEATTDLTSPAFSEEHLALEFTHRHGDRLRYVAAWGKWFEWEGRVWREDTTWRTFGLSRILCREMARGINDPKVNPKAIASRNTAANVMKLAAADRRHAAKVDQWDSDPWLLNTPAGTVDLRTGQLRQHDPDAYMTKMTAVAPGGECPLWLTFLDKVTAGDKELQRYLQRAAGYWLTGMTNEQALFFMWGTGGNGKGVFLNTIAKIMADYATTATMDTFVASNVTRHSTELAMLRGARLVTAQETEQNAQWAESRIKALTGEDPITARFMRQDNFTFLPTFSLVIAGNHKPGLTSVGAAIRRRMNLIPFTVEIPDGEKDTTLPDRLKAEWQGILAWMVQGCLEWQKGGLRPPAAVVAATADYLSGEDAIANWMADACNFDKNKDAGSMALYQSYKQWMLTAGERPIAQKVFSEELGKRGYPKEHKETGTRFIGLELKPTGVFSGEDAMTSPLPK